MIDQEYGRMRPLYEAMSVSSYTIEWLEQQEKERSDFELQFNLARVSNSLEEFIQVASSRNFLKPSKQNIFQGLIFCLETLQSMVQMLTSQTRALLPKVCVRLRQPIELLLDQIDTLAEKMEEILEGWIVVTDETLCAKIDVALAQMEHGKTEVGDWRQELELISD